MLHLPAPQQSIKERTDIIVENLFSLHLVSFDFALSLHCFLAKTVAYLGPYQTSTMLFFIRLSRLLFSQKKTS